MLLSCELVGIKLPTIEVRFEHVKVEAEADVASRALPSLYNFSVNIFEGILNYLHILPSKRRHLSILKDVSGIIKPSRMTLLLGPPSSGKTTLLLALAGKLDPNLKVSGDVTYNGHTMKEFVPQRTAAYISQYDLHLAQMTVRETLAFSARCQGVGFQHDLLVELLRREKSENIKPDPNIDVFMKHLRRQGPLFLMSLKTKSLRRVLVVAFSYHAKLFIEEVMELVELNDLRRALVGLPGLNGLSMEQRKRLTIAVELVANPSIIFMDEPTSGLDARAAAIVMRTVRNTVDTGRTVVCTIHQPSIDIFESFDELFLLKKGGQEIYAGPLGHHSAHLIQYFEAIEGVNKIKDGQNPATWMLEVTSVATEIALGVDFAAVYRISELYRHDSFCDKLFIFWRNKAIIKQLSTPAPDAKDLYFPTRFSQSSFTQFKACLWKQRQSYWRNPPYTAVKFLFAATVALVFGSIYWDLGSKMENRQDLFNSLGSMYVPLLFVGIQTSTSIQPIVAVERTVFYRERAAGMYSPLPYAFAQILIELPYVFVQATLYGVIIYAMIGFEWTAAKFFWYLFFLYFTLLYFTFYGMMSVAVTPNQHISYIVSTMFYGIWNLFSGFVVPRPLIPIWWRWYYWACPISWTLYGLLTSQYGNINDRRIETGQTVEDVLRTYFGYKYDFLGVVAAVVVGLGVLFALVFAFAIKVFNFQRR
ncbi:hypothetical protein Tsubulata_005889 [Turnera subulata]|uniref:ABC transporter domain-containing protein n=1 Tax=Turnera subulata TaxID=218843 RepID=A0A9Q0G3R0_9ROSI|nr:hypothetical protein Tsubulata_005889 [Turnera subulata]